MKKVIIRSAYFTNHKSKKTAVGIQIACDDMNDLQAFESDKPYGQMWLMLMAKTIAAIPKLYGPSEDIHLSLISGQPQCVLMAEKIERIVLKMFASRKVVDDHRIERIVIADGNHMARPNDPYYVEVAKQIWKCKEHFSHFSYEQHNKPSQEAAKVFNAARKLVG